MKYRLVKRDLLKKILFLISPFIGVFLLEILVRNSFVTTKVWIAESVYIYLFTVLIFLAIQFLILVLINNVYIAMFITYSLFGLMYLINKYKLELMDVPFLPWDLTLASQLTNLAPAISKSINLIGLMITLVLAVGLLILLIKYTEFDSLKKWTRICSGSIIIIFLFMISNYYSNFFKEFYDEIGVIRNQVDQKENQQTNGLILGFTINIPSALLDKPSNYSEKAVINDAAYISDHTYKTSELKPNIVVIMSEAFWETDNISVNYKGKSLHPNVSEHKIGQIISSNFGGSTANVEFEALTGFSMNNLPHGSMAYEEYIKRQIPSLPKLLMDEGYRTSAFHTYNKFFWNREEVYKFLGFEKFIGLEDLNNPKYNGFFVDDGVINDLVIEEIINNKEPSFIYAITMQNHGGYQDNRYEEDTLQLSNSLSPESNQILNTYGTGIKYSDELLADLITEIEQLNEPTLLVFFGDHLPALSNVYEEVGYIENMKSKTLKEELKTKQTPLAVWKNYGQEVEKIENMSASFLAPKILEWSEIKRPLFYDFLVDFQSKMPGYTTLVKLDDEGNLSIKVPDNYKLEDDIYKRIQYDILFGEKYYLKEFFTVN